MSSVLDLLLLPFRVLLSPVHWLITHLPVFKYKHVDDMDKTTKNFLGEFKQKDEHDIRRDKYRETTQTFYNLITDFYEYGWGHSFHFSPAWTGETFKEATTRYEHTFALKLGLRPGQKVVDVGCGIGGPMRTIAKFTGAHITGINITPEHIARGKRFNAQKNVKNCDFILADFNNIPVPDNTFEAGYDFEAILHSVDRERTFREVYRILKPGALFLTAQYCLLDAYDEKNPHHVDVIRRVDNTNGCYCAGNTTEKTTHSLENVGFEVLERTDYFDSQHSDIGFHEVFKSMRGGRFAGTKIGLFVTSTVIYCLETLRLLPTGTYRVQAMLNEAAKAFTEAGDLKILTPGMVYLCRKPVQAH